MSATEQVSVDTQAFRDAAVTLTTIKNEFDDADANTALASADIPHATLAETMQWFSASWDTRRQEFSDAIEIQNQMGNAIADHFEEYEANTTSAANDLTDGGGDEDGN